MSNNNNFVYQLVNYIINEKSNHYMKSQKLSLEKRFVRKSKFTFRLLTSPIRFTKMENHRMGNSKGLQIL